MKSARGFTLVELLVVVAIIAILSVVGMTVFGAIQKNARDARRKGDINAIATAFELNYSGGTYTLPGNSAFASGSAPKDPLDGQDNCTSTGNGPGGTQMKKCWYCLKGGTSIGCNDAAYPNFEVSDKISNSTDRNLGNTWMLCTNLENGETFCRKSLQ